MTGRATKKSQQIDAYQDLWRTLGIDNAPAKPQWNGKTWQKMVDKDGNVVTADKIMMASGLMGDSAIPSPGGYTSGMVNLNQINSLALDNVFLGWGELSLLQQNCIVNIICSVMAQSMTEKWIEFSSKDEAKADKIIELEKSITEFKVKDLMIQAVYNTMLLGTAYITPKIKGDEDKLKDELLLTSLHMRQGELEDIFCIEPTWVVPVDFNMVNPRARNFYKPQAYSSFGEVIHHSRMKKTVMIQPVNLISPMYLFGGVPPVQQILPYILDFINSKKEIVKIISRFNLSILQTNMNALKGSDAYGKNTTHAGNVKGRAATMAALRNNFGVFMIDVGETFTQMQINTSGLKDLLQQQAELLSLFTQIPVSKLFGEAPQGMNATGVYDAKNFNSMISARQESQLRPILEWIFKLLQLNLWGEIDDDIEFKFVPLGGLDELEQSQLKDGKVNRAVAVANAGIIDPASVGETLINDPDLEFGECSVSEEFDDDNE